MVVVVVDDSEVVDLVISVLGAVETVVEYTSEMKMCIKIYMCKCKYGS